MHSHGSPSAQDSDLHPRALAVRPYDRGLHDLGNGVFAYLQPDGSWGWSNAGLIVDGEDALLVDTLFDLHLTRRMLEQMRSADRRAESIDTVVITHANPDHTNGNSLLPDARVIASQRAADEMARDDPAMLAAIMRQAKANADPVSRYLVDCFGAFDFENIPKTVPDQPFVGQRSLQVGRKRIELIEIGSAHTGGDIVIHSPDDRVLYTGDLLFIGGHPIMWAGPIENWIAACDRLLPLDVQYVVPGHGPITDKRGIRAVRDYLALVENRATAAFRAGVSVADAARELEGELNRAGYSQWGDGERIIVTVASHYRHLGGATGATNVGAMFAEMARFRAGSPGRASG